MTARIVLFAFLMLILPVRGEQAPPLTIIAPTSGVTATVGEKVTVQLILRKDVQAKTQAVQVTCEGKGIALLNSGPYMATWDTAGMKPGRYLLEASAFLNSGNKLAAAPVEVILKSGAAKLPESTPVILTTQEKMVSGDTPTGTIVRLKVERDVLDQEGRILIPAGADATGEVVKSEGSGFFGKSGVLDFALRNVTAADGTSVPIRAQRSVEGDDNLGGVVAGAVLLSVFFVFMSGSQVDIPAGTVFTGYVSKDTDIPNPAPAKVDQATFAMARSVEIQSPVNNASFEPTDHMTFSVFLSPPDDDAYIRLYWDGRLLVAQRGNPGKIEWKGNDDLQPGLHVLEAEVTYSMGKVVKSAPIKVTITD